VNSDIELEIGAGSGTDVYAVRVVRSVAGGEPTGTLELDVESILNGRGLLQATLLASAVASRSIPEAEQPVREVGRQLFRALFNGPVYGMYRASLGVAQQRGHRLRIVLRLTAPELAALPWEMLFDPETETYLCRQEPLVRHVPAPYTVDPLQVEPPLRVLGLVASPRGLHPLDVEAEKFHIEEGLAGPIAEGLMEMTWVPEATWHGVHARLLAGQWHVLHFIGHGDYDSRTDEGLLAFVGTDGRPDMIEASRLADLLGEAQPAPRLVVLNSCSSGHTGLHDLFSGTGAALARSGISAVAAMQFTISDPAAVAFARGFYTAIANGRNVDEAARSGRISILGARHSLEWATPVLYVRGEATRLYSFPESSGIRREHRSTQRAEGPNEAQSGTQAARRSPPEISHPEELQRISGQHAVNAVSWHPGGSHIAVADTSAFAKVYDISGKEPWEKLRIKGGGWTLGVLDVAFSPDGSELATGSANKHAYIWDSADGRLLLNLNQGNWVRAVAFSLDGTRLATGSSGPWVKIWDTHSGNELFRFIYNKRGQGLAFSSDVMRLATGGGDAGVWDTTSGEKLLEVRHSDEVKAAAFSPDGTRLATGSADHTARIWDIPSGEKLLEVRHSDKVWAAAFSPDGTRLATGSADHTARIWDIPSGEKLLEVRHSDKVWAAAFSPDGTRLATGSADHTARIWDIPSGEKLLEVRHSDKVWATAFSPDGTRLATGSADHTARIWSTAGL
jgi:hypothetical protein